jgi:putative addiction module CopG family antidote
MNMHLSEDLERRIQEKVDSGLYRSADEVLSTALRVLDERDQDLDTRATAFQMEIEQRLASGPATAMDFSALKKSIREEAKARQDERG